MLLEHSNLAALASLILLTGQGGALESILGLVLGPTETKVTVFPPVPPQSLFASSVAIQGDALLVGSPWGGETQQPGRVFDFENASDWTVLTSSDVEFGYEVALSGHWLAVRGATEVTVFRDTATGWVVDDLLPSSGFVRSMAMSGNVIASSQVGGGLPAPTIDVYENTADGAVWTKVSSLTPPNGASFGAGLAVTRDWLVAGWSGGSPERVFLFRRNGLGSWELHQELLSPVADDVGFGAECAISGDLLAVSAIEDGPANSGSVFLHRWTETAGWVPEQQLRPRPGKEDETFGHSMVLARDRIFVGAVTASVRGFASSGKVYEYRASGGAGEWKLVRVLHASDFDKVSWFGMSLAWHDGRLAVGATGPDAVISLNAVYIFDYSELP